MEIEKIVYKAPVAKIVEMCSQEIICGSENESMREVDLGDGGFTEQ